MNTEEIINKAKHDIFEKIFDDYIKNEYNSEWFFNKAFSAGVEEGKKETLSELELRKAEIKCLKEDNKIIYSKACEDIIEIYLKFQNKGNFYNDDFIKEIRKLQEGKQ